MSHVNTSDAEQGSTPLKSNQVKERRPARQSSVFSTKRRQVSSATGPTRSQKRKRTELDTAENSLEPNSDLDSESNPDVAVMDITQDSDCDNTKMKPGAKKTRGPAVTEFDDVEMYFESPVPAKGDKNGKKLFYKCKWCSKPYKKGASGGPTCGYIVMGGWDGPLALVGVLQLKQVVQICQGRGRRFRQTNKNDAFKFCQQCGVQQPGPQSNPCYMAYPSFASLDETGGRSSPDFFQLCSPRHKAIYSDLGSN
ncbi:hypothetical protein PSHT_03443 [Puccinia striiformis]|uniref:Uncharacterized protein n=1 Tax=Puccinia striiformis TaxID=27350 RepID=A0A2S4WFQ1_9BASI|nr:hypothetical protein PSHT_03443 [Puccinia striiformis]